MTDEQRALLLQIAHNFPVSDGVYEWAEPVADGIYEWAEHLEQHPELAKLELTEQTAPVVAWLIVRLWESAGGGVPRVEPPWAAGRSER